MRWRPAVGVLVLGGIAIGLTIQGVSAERSRTSQREEKAAKSAVQLALAAEMTPQGAQPIYNLAASKEAPEKAAAQKPINVKTPGIMPVSPASERTAKPTDQSRSDLFRLEVEQGGGKRHEVEELPAVEIISAEHALAQDWKPGSVYLTCTTGD
jgi:hypothetical protein